MLSLLISRLSFSVVYSIILQDEIQDKNHLTLIYKRTLQLFSHFPCTIRFSSPINWRRAAGAQEGRAQAGRKAQRCAVCIFQSQRRNQFQRILGVVRQQKNLHAFCARILQKSDHLVHAANMGLFARRRCNQQHFLFEWVLGRFVACTYDGVDQMQPMPFGNVK